MPFYDNVKDDIRNENGSEKEEESTEQRETMGFDQLRKGAETREESVEQKDKPGDDTEIEVLRDGKLEKEGDTAPASGFPERETSASDTGKDGSQAKQAADTATRSMSQPAASTQATPAESGDAAVELLEQVVEQNEEIIGLLRGIKRGLDQ